PKLVEIAMGAKNEAEEQAALRAAVAAGAEVANADERAKPFIDAAANVRGAKRAGISRGRARVGGAKAFEVVAGDLKSEDNAVREGAIRALGEWSDPAAVGPLLEIASSEGTSMAQQVIALRGAVNVTKASGLSPAQKVTAYSKALSAAR